MANSSKLRAGCVAVICAVIGAVQVTGLASHLYWKATIIGGVVAFIVSAVANVFLSTCGSFFRWQHLRATSNKLALILAAWRPRSSFSFLFPPP